MGYFYFDETIQEKGGFIIGAFAYSKQDLTPKVFSAIQEVGLIPKLNEFKSGINMSRNSVQSSLRNKLKNIVADGASIGLLVMPETKRQELGNEALKCLSKLLNANELNKIEHEAFFDAGIKFSNSSLKEFPYNKTCKLHLEQDSKLIGGIQIADLIAHTLGIMLLDELGLVSKKLLVGENGGYDPPIEVEIGYILWTTVRYNFFRGKEAIGATEEDPFGTLTYNVEDYGLYITSSCSQLLTNAAISKFGECYVGCIH